MSQTPVLVIGAGPVGMTLALALHAKGLACTLVDARARGAAARDARVLALSHGSRQLLERLGVWAHLDPTPIRRIHVSHRGHFGRSLLRAEDHGLPALGYVLPAGALARVLDEALLQAQLAVLDATPVGNVAAGAADVLVSAPSRAPLRAQLVVHAEGAAGEGEDVVRRDYGQQAVIGQARTAAPHQGLAYERFTDEGPVALLPCGDVYAVVYTAAAGEAQRLASLDDARFVEALQQPFGERVEFTGVGPRAVFPLALRYRRETVARRAVWLGNSAQTLHPVAGQGFNLALRDVWTLAGTLARASDPGDPAVLARYGEARRLDRNAVIRTTDALVRLFGSGAPLAAALRGGGLLALDLLPPLSEFFARRMMFGARAW